MYTKPGSAGFISIWFTLQDPAYATTSAVASVGSGSTATIEITTDQFANVLNVALDGQAYLDSPVTHSAPAVIVSSGTSQDSVSITQRPVPSSMQLCTDLAKQN